MITTALKIERTRDRDGYAWHITSDVDLTDQQARDFTWISFDPSEVVMGEHVQIHDPSGTRTGHIAKATYETRAFGPALVLIETNLL